MNRIHLLRLAWKDYRRIGVFWLVFVLFAAGCLSVITWLAFREDRLAAPFTIESTAFIILSTAMVYSLGWSAITFSAEHDEKTYDFLRSLPLHAKSVFYGKLLYGVVSAVSLILVLSALCWVHDLILRLAGGTGYQWSTEADAFADLRAFLLSMAIMIPLTMTLGMFWSLRTKRPLWALVLTAASMVIVPYVSAASLALSHRLVSPRLEPTHLDRWTALILCGFTVAFFMVDRSLALRWLPNYQIADRSLTRARVAMDRLPRGFGRLCWLNWNQTWKSTVILASLAILLVLIGIGSLDQITCVLALFVVGLLGAMTFRSEYSEHRYRLLAQLGVSPAGYAASQLLLPGGVALVAATLLSIAARDTTPGHHYYGVLFGLGSFMVFSVAQFCSLAFPSIVITIAVTLTASVVLWSWVALCLANGAPVWLTFAPPILLPLCATWLRVPRWFRDTGDWRQWCVPGLPVLLLIFAAPVAMALFRVYEVPSAKLPEDVARMLADVGGPEDGPDSSGYQGVLSRLPQSWHASSIDIHERMKDPTLQIWVQGNVGRETIDQLISLTANDTPIAFATLMEPNGSLNTAPLINATATLLLTAKRFEAAGDPAEAWRHYAATLQMSRQLTGKRSVAGVRLLAQLIERAVFDALVVWSMHEQNSATRIEEAVAFLDRHRRGQPPLIDALKANFVDYHTLLNDRAWLETNYRHAPDVAQRLAFLSYTPWELTRTKRLLAYIYQGHFDRALTPRTAAGDRWTKKPDGSLVEIVQRPVQEPLTTRLAATTLLGDLVTEVNADELETAFEDAENVRRGTMYQLTAIAYHHRHGEYPESFHGLRIGDHELPGDLYTPEQQMVITVDHAPRPVTGKFVVTPLLTQTITYSDAAGMRRHFLLPQFESWSIENFEARLTAGSQRMADYRMGEVDLEGVNYFVPTSERLDRIMEQIDDASRGSVLSAGVERLLQEGAQSQRLQVLQAIESSGSMMEAFLPGIVEILEDPSVDVRAAAAATLRKQLPELASDTFINEFPDAFSILEVQGSEESKRNLAGIPIRNDTNGHYYEALAILELGVVSWQDAVEAASQRRFRGLRGHLVTITSREENEFLLRALFGWKQIDPAFQGLTAGIDAEHNGVWKWGCGPEQGETFWIEATGEGQFEAWNSRFGAAGDDSSDAHVANHLIWCVTRGPSDEEASVDDDGSPWRPVWRKSAWWNGSTGPETHLIVEYSLPNSTAGPP